MLRVSGAVLSGLTLLAALPGASAAYAALTAHESRAADSSATKPGAGLTRALPAAAPASAAQVGAAQPGATSRPGAGRPDPAHTNGCLQSGNGYLRARIRGALNLDIDWHNSEIECEGGARPNGSGLRVSFAGPLQSDGRRLRMVFGVGAAKEGRPGREMPTNLTVIFEGEERLFATRGQDRCTVDELEQERLGALGGPRRSYRIVARGFCIDPASTLNGDGHILVSRFDFAGTATFEDEAAADAGTPKT
jgi:hypothetical protein